MRYFVPSCADMQTAALGLLAYNVAAFGLQPFIGWWCDKHGGLYTGVLGCALVFVSLPCGGIPTLALALCALGNACFHVSGGIDALTRANGKMSRSGVFVSSGALGVVFGTAAGKSEAVSVLLPLALCAASVAALVFTARKSADSTARPFGAASPLAFGVLVALGSLVVLLRAFAGGLFSSEWKTTTALVYLSGGAACIGKAAGGFLADRFGARRTAILSLLASLALLCFARSSAVLSLIGIAAFNMTMPITLCILCDALPDTPGFAFGLSTLALLCGTAPYFFFSIPAQLKAPLLFVLTLLSAALVFLAAKNKTRCRNEKESVQKAQ